MARHARGKTINPQEIQIVHAFNRCVRRAYLCGLDPLTGIDYDYRREYSLQRLKRLASCFAIDLISFSIMSNHTHQILRSRPDVVTCWSDREVALRWLRINAKTEADGSLAQPAECEIQVLVNDPAKLKRLRIRLSDISWWMREYAQRVAVRCNREDETKGAFWESRFGSEVLAGESDLLACMIYIDLNPVRAVMAATPEESDYTSVKSRSDDLRVRLLEHDQSSLRLSSTGEQRWERLDGGFESSFLAPVYIDERCDPLGPDLQGPRPATETPSHKPNEHQTASAAGAESAAAIPSSTSREFEPHGRLLEWGTWPSRASAKGVLPITVEEYLKLVDFKGRQIRSDKRGAIDSSLASVLDRLSVSESELDQQLQCVITRCSDYDAPPAVTMNPYYASVHASAPLNSLDASSAKLTAEESLAREAPSRYALRRPSSEEENQRLTQVHGRRGQHLQRVGG